MKKEEFIVLLKNSTSINEVSYKQLEQILYDFPYFQAARAIQLKALKKQHSIKYNFSLRKTAAYTTDRNLLFNLIVDKKFQEKPHIKLSNKETAKKILQIGEPIQFISSSTHSFNEWLQLARFKPINRNAALEKEDIDSNFNLINKFIKNSHKIKPIENLPFNKNFSKKSTKENIDLMTETLARVYLEQKKFKKAIAAYTILSLKFPEKSSFFADRIKAIKFLQKHNS